MKNYQSVAGISEIKKLLIENSITKKQINHLELWFSFVDGVLFVHDFEKHCTKFALAIYNSKDNSWNVTIPDNGFSYRLLYEVTKLKDPKLVLKKLIELNESFGFRVSR